MQIKTVEAFAVHAPLEHDRPYWGSRTWGSAAPAQTQTGLNLSSRYPPPQRRRFIYSTTVDTVIVRLTADDGTVGWGEAKAPVAPGVTKAIIDELLAPLIVGQPAEEPTVQWERMYAGMRVRGHDSGFYLEAISGVDIALHDLRGKLLGQPIHQLLGGAFRQQLPLYASGIPGVSLSAPPEAWDELRAQAEEFLTRGFKAIKIALGRDVPSDIRTVEAVREAVGDNILLLVDAAGAYDPMQALQLGQALERLNVGWFEMPIPPELVDGYALLGSKLNLPIALDSLATRHATLDLLKRSGLHIAQPDVCRAGGITECMRIGVIADAFGAVCTPHISIGSAIHLAASAQVAAALPNFSIMEYWTGNNPLGAPVLRQPFAPQDGFLTVPGGPGLGIEIDEAALLRWAS